MALNTRTLRAEGDVYFKRFQSTYNQEQDLGVRTSSVYVLYMYSFSPLFAFDDG